MQTFQILLNNKYTAATQFVTATTENIGLGNDYYVYSISNGGGIVNFSNVRGYLNDPRNVQITNDFFTYLTGNTNSSQSLNILGSDEKLASVFNDYYQRIILSATQISSTAVIQQNLTGATQIVGKTFNHLWNGFAPSKQLTGITLDIYNSSNNIKNHNIWQEFTKEESYYIPVYIERGTNQIAEYKFDFCDTIINKNSKNFFPEFSAITETFTSSSATTASTKINTIIDCFVDINLETNENLKTTLRTATIILDMTNPNVNAVPNPNPPNYIFTIKEGSTFDLIVNLDGPASGLEKIIINSIGFFLASATPGVDFSPASFPISVAFNVGETEKRIPIVLFKDNIIDGFESIVLQLANPIVCKIGNPQQAIMLILD